MTRLTKLINRPKVFLPLLVTVGLILFSVLRFLISIHFQIGDYFEYVFFRDHINFKPYQTEFHLLAKQMYLFADGRPDFFEVFTGECHLIEEGLMFFQNGLDYPDNVYIHPVAEEDWAGAVHTCYNAFPSGFYFEHGSPRIDPNHIIFCSSFGRGKLVFSFDGRYPKELIDGYWKTNRFVSVRNLDRGWYEVMLFE